MDIKLDTSDFFKKLEAFLDKSDKAVDKAMFEVGSEVLRLSAQENPHDKGLLQSSQAIEPEKDGYVFGYNKEYAARLHEHPEFNFQKGRKGKYLEDPIKHNLKVFLKHLGDIVKNRL